MRKIDVFSKQRKDPRTFLGECVSLARQRSVLEKRARARAPRLGRGRMRLDLISSSCGDKNSSLSSTATHEELSLEILITLESLGVVITEQNILPIY